MLSKRAFDKTITKTIREGFVELGWFEHPTLSLGNLCSILLSYNSISFLYSHTRRLGASLSTIESLIYYMKNTIYIAIGLSAYISPVSASSSGSSLNLLSLWMTKDFLDSSTTEIL